MMKRVSRGIETRCLIDYLPNVLRSGVKRTGGENASIQGAARVPVPGSWSQISPNRSGISNRWEGASQMRYRKSSKDGADVSLFGVLDAVDGRPSFSGNAQASVLACSNHQPRVQVLFFAVRATVKEEGASLGRRLDARWTLVRRQDQRLLLADSFRRQNSPDDQERKQINEARCCVGQVASEPYKCSVPDVRRLHQAETAFPKFRACKELIHR
jgi:hypothetical protein